MSNGNVTTESAATVSDSSPTSGSAGFLLCNNSNKPKLTPEELEDMIAGRRREESSICRVIYELGEELKKVCPHKSGVRQFEGDGFCKRCGEYVDD